MSSCCVSTRHALVIGNDAYAAMPPLHCSANDATDVHALLLGKGGYTLSHVPLLNTTRLALVEAVKGFARSLPPNATAFVLSVAES